MLVSIVMPLYNKRAFVAEAVASALAQTYSQIEVIVVDDGSSDGSGDVVAALADPRVRLVRQANAGVSASRNRGIAEARGDLVAFLDADDWYHPRFVETVVALAQQHTDVQVFGTRFKRRTDADFPGSDWPEATHSGATHIPDLATHWLIDPLVFTSSICVRRPLLLALQPCFPLGDSLGEDLDLWLRLNERSPLVVAHAQCAAYRVGLAGSLSTRSAGRRLLPYLERLAARVRSGQVPAALQRSRLRLVANAKVTLAREALKAGCRWEAMRHLGGALDAVGMHRFWVTLAMVTLMPGALVRRWDQWRMPGAA
jgi:glycosyltransferase involved in cell wall biosynthesis